MSPITVSGIICYSIFNVEQRLLNIDRSILINGLESIKGKASPSALRIFFPNSTHYADLLCLDSRISFD